jgi:hypothetical protein
MIIHSKQFRSLILSLAMLLLLPGCYDMTIQVVKLPPTTPPSEPIYICGNFNNWDPGDPDYVLALNADSVYEVSLPKGVGEIEYKFTRGDWSTVEKDHCGFEIDNRAARYGNDRVFRDTILSWNDLPKPGCPSITLIVEALPEETPENAVLYFAANLNNWDPGSRYWVFTRGLDGRYYIEIPRTGRDNIEFKVTRGDWRSVECDANGDDIDNRAIFGKAGEEMRIVIEGWKDRR